MILDRAEFNALSELARCRGYLLRAGTDASHPFTILRRGDHITVNTFSDLEGVRDWLSD